jgi:hypothetical protein
MRWAGHDRIVDVDLQPCPAVVDMHHAELVGEGAPFLIQPREVTVGGLVVIDLGRD